MMHTSNSAAYASIEQPSMDDPTIARPRVSSGFVGARPSTSFETHNYTYGLSLDHLRPTIDLRFGK